MEASEVEAVRRPINGHTNVLSDSRGEGGVVPVSSVKAATASSLLHVFGKMADLDSPSEYRCACVGLFFNCYGFHSPSFVILSFFSSFPRRRYRISTIHLESPEPLFLRMSSLPGNEATTAKSKDKLKPRKGGCITTACQPCRKRKTKVNCFAWSFSPPLTRFLLSATERFLSATHAVLTKQSAAMIFTMTEGGKIQIAPYFLL